LPNLLHSVASKTQLMAARKVRRFGATVYVDQLTFSLCASSPRHSYWTKTSLSFFSLLAGFGSSDHHLCYTATWETQRITHTHTHAHTHTHTHTH